MKTTSCCAWLVAGVGLLGVGCGGDIESTVASESQALDKTWVVFPVADNPAAGISGFVQSNETGDGRTHVSLQVSGLPPNRGFGSHVHALPCETNQAGGHYRNDPAGPATADNEIWLDFTTNAAGRGQAQAIANFLIRPDGANAVAVHDHETDPVTGAAGPKLACINHDF